MDSETITEMMEYKKLYQLLVSDHQLLVPDDIIEDAMKKRTRGN